jgi:hypothetical protein
VIYFIFFTCGIPLGFCTLVGCLIAVLGWGGDTLVVAASRSECDNHRGIVPMPCIYGDLFPKRIHSSSAPRSSTSTYTELVLESSSSTHLTGPR